MITGKGRKQGKLRCLVCIFLLASVLISCPLSTVYAFDVDVHYYLKYYLLRKVGFTEEEAGIIARADVSTDSGDTSAGFAYENNNPKWHALASKEDNDIRQEELWNRAKAALLEDTLEKRLIPFGQFLHFLEDRTAHEGYGWFFGHGFKGHKVDYLSYYDLATIQSAVENWLTSMKQFFKLLKGHDGNPVTWNDVAGTVGNVRNANPTYHFWSSPNASAAKNVINEALKNEIDPNEWIAGQTDYKFDKNGNLTGMIPRQGFTFPSEGLECNNQTVLNTIAVIQNSPYLENHSEAYTAIQCLYNFTYEQEAVSPSINSLHYAIINMIGLASEDSEVLNVTTHVSLLMLDSVFQRELHVLYLRTVRGWNGAGEKMQLAYAMISLAEPEIQKMETNPSAVDFGALSQDLMSAWGYMADAEREALVPSTPPNPPARPMQIYEATIDGGDPETVDPAWAYDTASAEMISNVYDTLITMNGEHMDTFLPVIAESWTLQNITGTTSPEGVAWYYRYVFKLRNWANMTFQPPYNYPITAADVEYSFERAMTQDRTSGGPEWMFYEPLFNNWGSEGLGTGDLYTDEANAHTVGLMIDHAVEQNGTHIWFNIGFPGAYAPFMQILCQSWSSIMSKQWIVNQVPADWDGNWALVRSGWTLDHTEWVDHHDPAVSPLDVGGTEGGLMYGSGPFMLTEYNLDGNYFIMNRHVAHFRGWPAPFPSMAAAKPAGYVDEFKVTWAFDWATRKQMFLAGDVDFCAVPRQYISEIHQSVTPPYLPPNYPQDGIRLIQPLPSFSIDGVFFTFDVNPTTNYGPINAPGVFTETGIPSDFFGNPDWGIHVRKGFAWAFDYARYTSEAFLGEGIHPATFILPGTQYYDPTVVGYTQNLANAAAEFAQVPGLKFKIKALYNTGNIARLTTATIFRDVLQSMSPLYHVDVLGITWSQYLTAARQQKTPFFIMGWLADYPDPHNFASPFYYTYGAYPVWQKYSNATMDALIDLGIKTPDGPARAAIYKQIQELAIADCPSMPLTQSKGRHYERDWCVGWYYNPIYTGTYAYNIWKWYYTPHVRSNPPAQPISYNLAADCNYDGKVDIKDVSTAAKSFGAISGPPPDARWVFRVDFNNDRKIDIKDVSYVAKHFGSTTTAIWVPS